MSDAKFPPMPTFTADPAAKNVSSLGKVVTAELKFVSPEYHFSVRDRLQARVIELEHVILSCQEIIDGGGMLSAVEAMLATAQVGAPPSSTEEQKK